MSTSSSETGASGSGKTVEPKCRFCGAALSRVFLDLGLSPLCQTQISPDQVNQGEAFYPLRVFVCDSCYLVQLDEYVSPDVIFGENYPYFSSYSESWVRHAKTYTDRMVAE